MEALVHRHGQPSPGDRDRGRLPRHGGGDLDLSDTSDYPKDHFLYSLENKKVLEKMKDECAGIPIKKVVCLRPKMYSVKMASKTIKKVNGTTKTVTKKELHN